MTATAISFEQAFSILQANQIQATDIAIISDLEDKMVIISNYEYETFALTYINPDSLEVIKTIELTEEKYNNAINSL